MKRNILICALTLVTSALIAADAKSDVSAGIKQLAGKGNYSWKNTVEMGGGGAAGGAGGRGGGRGGGGLTEGKIDKDGTSMLTMTRGETKTEIVIKDGKGAIKGPEGWQSVGEAAEAGGGGGGGGGGRGGNPGRMMGRMVETFKAPATQAQDILGKTKDLKKTDDGYAGDLTEEGAKEMLSFGGGRAGGNGPEISNPKGTAKFWLKDGVLSKYELTVSGSMSFNGNERKLDRTTKVEFSDVGTTKVSVPDDARKKL